jgi:hypothetical protein
MHLLFGHNPDYNLLCTFGCVCWPNLCPYNTHKFAFRSALCVFLGYSNQHKGYKCLEPSSGRVYISRDVIFDETVCPFSTLHPNAGAHLQAEILLRYPTLCNAHEGERVGEPNVTNVADTTIESFADTGDSGVEDGANDGEILAPGSAGAPTCDINHQQLNATVVEDSDIEIGGDRLSREAGSCCERIPNVSDRERISAEFVPHTSGAVAVTPPDGILCSCGGSWCANRINK